MKAKILLFWVGCLLWLSANGDADFKYTESAKVTGGMMASMMQVMGAFNQQAGNSSKPMESSTYVKDDRLRRDEPTGKIEIIDLGRHLIIGIDPQSRSYSIITFDEMRTALHEAATQNGSANARMIPKVEFRPVAATRTILSQRAHEVKIQMDMEMQSKDAQGKAQTTSFWYSSDTWVAYTVHGYDEVRKFYEAMGQDLDWVPGQMFGGTSGISPAMEEFRKSLARMQGFPLLQSASFGASDQGGQGGSHQAHTGSSNSSSFLDMTIEVTSFSDSPLNETLLQIPAGYTQVEQGTRDVR
jgi:hypothetical protein